MYNRQMLIDLIEKCREALFSGPDYIVSNQLLNKIKASMVPSKTDDIGVNLQELCNLSNKEMSMFTSLECSRIISSFKVISNKKGWRVETVVKLIKSLEEDINNNKIKEIKKKSDSLDELSRVIEEGLFLDNYNLILDFIKLCVENKVVSSKEAVNLNFYVLKEIHGPDYNNINDNNIEEIKLDKMLSSIDASKRVEEIFSKYGYTYDQGKMTKLIKVIADNSDLDYLDYILSNFKNYGIDNKELYTKKRVLLNILVARDKESFDLVLKFLDENKCTLSTLLGIPMIFTSNKKKIKITGDSEFAETNDGYEVVGANKCFFDNVELYKKLSGNSVINDYDLNKLLKFVSTPSSVVSKNLKILERYGIVHDKELTKKYLSFGGNYTEYVLDRFIELGLYRDYLLLRATSDGQVKYPRGLTYLDWNDNPFPFYKMKRAIDFGDSIFAVNGGLRNTISNDKESYMGISYKRESDDIVQQSLSSDFIKSKDSRIRKGLPYLVLRKVNNGLISSDSLDSIHFEYLYKYQVFSSVDIFEDKLKGVLVNSIFAKDYQHVMTAEEEKGILRDPYVNLLDNATYCDSDGNSKPLKKSKYEYIFVHPENPGERVIVSRNKVLRLCKLLKENGCFINDSCLDSDCEDTLLAVIAKDSVLSSSQLLLIRNVLNEVLNNGLVRVSAVDSSVKKRGVK